VEPFQGSKWVARFLTQGARRSAATLGFGVEHRWRREIFRIARDDDGCAAAPRPCIGVKLVVYNRAIWGFGHSAADLGVR
jgi:hypothetical protein